MGSLTHIQVPDLLPTYIDALELESERVVRIVQAPLEELVSARLHCSSSSSNSSSHGLLDSAQPVLTLHFARPNKGLWRFYGRNGINTKRISAALDAITLVWSHVAMLKRHHKLRAAFWRALLGSKIMVEAVSNDTLTQLTSEQQQQGTASSSVRIVLDFSSRRAKLNRKWFDALYKFLTDQPHLPAFITRFFEKHKKTATPNLASSKIYFGLSFTNSCLTVKSLVMIQRLLDCVAPGHSRHFGIDMLDLSHNAMTAEHLDVVIMILRRNLLYQIDDIRLDEIIMNPVVRHESAKVRDLLAAAFVSPRIPAETRIELRATKPRISLATNSFSAENFISVCSALRYDCVFEELSLTSMIRHVAPSEQELCWRWLAFGIFYPRSRRFASLFQLRKVNVRYSDISAEAVEAFANALYNPVAEIRRPGQPEDMDAMDAVLVGTITKGTTVYTSADSLSRPLLTLTHTRELEILHSRNDTEWICVIVAGVGLGWVEADNVLTVERDLMDGGGAEAARFDLIVTGDEGPRAARSLTDEAHTFIETVGRQLRSLAIRECTSLSLQNIVYHCKYMIHLDLEGCVLEGSSFSDLRGCLHGHFGKRILSLNLNRTGLTNDNIAALAKLLTTPRKLPLLRELRLREVCINHTGLKSLHAALARNKTLAVLELDDRDDALYGLRCARIDASFQNELLAPTPLSLRQRLALLSVVSGPNAAIKTDEELERRVYESIFRFAEERERRKIIWTKSA